METLPSLHLFCKKSFQNVHYHDLDYLKGSKQLQIIPQDVSLKSNILNENTKVSFPQLKMFYDYLSKSEQTEKCRVILFNSPAKHTESANGIIDFAKILAQHGNRILVLDCDFRTGISQIFFDLQPGMGVTDYVSGNIDLDFIMHETGIKETYFISCGNSVSNPVKLLMSKKFIQLIDDLKDRFDYVLINSPPYEDCIDAFVLAKFLRPIVLLLGSQTESHSEEISAVRDELGVLKLQVIEMAEA
ncbi:MAG: hypothetical protein E2O77_07835 [Caldithrix sp.]|nr:MAG: hypothetical protein E2O77_07835 [Caldithrix sp.]